MTTTVDQGGPVEEYVRRPIPDATLTTVHGRPVALTDLTRTGAALVVFTDAVAADVIAELQGWKQRLPRLRVVAVTSHVADAVAGAVTAAVAGDVLRDPEGRTRNALASADALDGPIAVLLGADGLLAGGPVGGLDAVRSLVTELEARFAEASGTPRVLVTSAAMGSRLSNSVTLPQEWRGRHLDVDFICFNDATHATREHAMHPRLAGKIPRMLAWEIHPGYDYYLWMDLRFSMTRPDAVGWFLDQLGDHDAAFFRHRYRMSIKEELDFVLSGMRAGNEYLLERYAGEDMERQVESYLGDPTFNDTLLIESGAFIYSSRIVQDARSNVMKEWFHQNCRWSVQDQLSLPYVLHQFDVDVVMLDSPSIYECEYLH